MNRYGLLVLMLWWISGCAAYTATSGQVVLKDDAAAAVRFSAGDRAMILDYYRNSARETAVPGTMPLLRDGWLPAGVRAEPLPPALERKLSPIPASHARWKVGGDIVLVEKKTRAINDVIYDALK